MICDKHLKEGYPDALNWNQKSQQYRDFVATANSWHRSKNGVGAVTFFCIGKKIMKLDKKNHYSRTIHDSASHKYTPTVHTFPPSWRTQFKQMKSSKKSDSISGRLRSSQVSNKLTKDEAAMAATGKKSNAKESGLSLSAFHCAFSFSFTCSDHFHSHLPVFACDLWRLVNAIAAKAQYQQCENQESLLKRAKLKAESSKKKVVPDPNPQVSVGAKRKLKQSHGQSDEESDGKGETLETPGNDEETSGPPANKRQRLLSSQSKSNKRRSKASRSRVAQSVVCYSLQYIFDVCGVYVVCTWCVRGMSPLCFTFRVVWCFFVLAGATSISAYSKRLSKCFKGTKQMSTNTYRYG